MATMREQLGPFLDRLIQRLAANRFEVSVEQIIEANNLRIAQFWTGRGPIDRDFLKLSLASIFCGTPEEQARFYELFDTLDLPAVEAGPEAPRAATRAEKRRDPLRRFKRRRRLWPVLLTLLFAGLGALAVSLWLQSQAPAAGPSVGTQAGAAMGGSSALRSTSDGAEFFTPPPRPPAEPRLILPEQERGWRAFRWGASSLPVLITLALLISAFSERRISLKEVRTRLKPQLEALPIARARGQLFGEADVQRSVAVLRVPARYPTRRLDAPATVNATARKGGIPELVFARQARRPGYVMLLQQRSPLDMFTRLAAKLADRLYAEGLELSSFVFEGRPARLFPSGQPGRDSSYEQVAQQYQGDALIIAGDAALVRQGARAQADVWAPGPGEWTSAALLSSRPGELWGRHERELQQQGFGIAGFGSEGLGAVRGWLNPQRLRGREDGAPWIGGHDEQAPFPPLLRDSERRWLRDRAPADPAQLLEQLETYLGADGMLLLAAIAAYPQLKFDIALFLEHALFGEEADARREQRLCRVMSLPWCRLTQMPDYLREQLIKRCEPAQLGRIQQTYRRLLDGNLRGDEADAPSVDIAVVGSDDWLAYVKGLLTTARAGTYSDAIFQNVMLEKPDRLLEIELTRATADELGGQRWQDAVAHSARRMARAVAAAAVLLGALTLVVKPIGDAQLAQRTAEANGKLTVEIAYPPGGGATGYTSDEARAIAVLGERLGYALDALGFQTRRRPLTGDEGAPLAVVRQAADTNVFPDNLIEYDGAFGISRVRRLEIALQDASWATRLLTVPNAVFAGQVSEALAYLTYDHPVRLQDVGTGGATIRVVLRSPVQSFQDRLAKGGLGPVMTLVPVPTPARSADPARWLAIGKFEIAFDEYDRFARATGRDLPDDNGWGRGRRPVINVSRADADAYVDWLSNETGVSYYLPGEYDWRPLAEGDIGTDTAAAGSGRTRPVEDTTANSRRIHGLGGNVSELTTDCVAQVTDRGGNPLGASSCGDDLVMGGNWRDGPSTLSSTLRAGTGSATVGIRVMRRVAPQYAEPPAQGK